MIRVSKEPAPTGPARGDRDDVATIRLALAAWATAAQLAAALNLFQRFAEQSPGAASEIMLTAIGLKQRLDLEWQILMKGFKP